MKTCAPIDSNAVGLYVGDPVNVVTGANAYTNLDLELRGPLPFRWRRFYDSSRNHHPGKLGWGHSHDFDHSLVVDLDGIRYCDPLGNGPGFPFFDRDGEERAVDGVRLRRVTPRHYHVVPLDAPLMVFEFDESGTRGVLKELYRDGQSIRFDYADRGRLSRITDSLGRSIRVVHDDEGRLVMLVLEEGSSPRTLVHCHYDHAGNLVQEVDLYGNSFRFEYDSNNRMTAKTDRTGYTFYFEYDDRGRCIHSQGADGLHEVHLEYSPHTNSTLVRRHDGGEWIYKYDERANVVEVVSPNDASTQMQFDEQGRAVEETDPLGNSTRNVYNAWGQQTGRIDPLGYRLASPEDFPVDPLVYELPSTPLGWEFGELVDRAGIGPVEADDPLLSRFSPSIFNAFGDRTTAYDPTLAETSDATIATTHSEHRQFDPNGNMISHRDRDGSVHRFRFGSWEMLQEEIDPLGNSTKFDYSPFESLTRLEEPNGTRHEFIYDEEDRLIEVSYAGQVLERYEYDSAGNIVAKRDGDGNLLIEWEIGPGNLDKVRRFASGAEHTFDHDERGRLLVATSPAGAVQREYDSVGRVVLDKRNDVGVEHAFTEGRLASTTYLDRFRIGYRSVGERTRVIVDPTGATHRIEIGSGGVVAKFFANGSRELSQYDSAGRCRRKGIVDDTLDRLRRIRSYGYSATGDLRAVADTETGLTRYGYDPSHRLFMETSAGGELRQFVHDSSGNVVEHPGLTDTETTTGNRLSRANGDSFGYDKRGNLSSRSGPSGTTRYTYNELDLLVECDLNGKAWSAEYDALCRRTTKTVDGRTTTFYWDDFRLAAEVRPDGSVRVYVYADEMALVPLMFVEYESLDSDPKSGKRYYVFTNQIGVPIAVEDDFGRRVWSARIEAYGQARVDSSSTVEMPLRFPGHYHDSETGLHYNRFRYYSPELARYLQLDPLGIEGGVNLYAYPARPLVDVDLDGLCHDTKKTRGKKSTGQKGKGSKKSRQKKPEVLDEKYHPTLSKKKIRELKAELDPKADALHSLIKKKHAEGKKTITQDDLRGVDGLEDVTLPHPLKTNPGNSPTSPKPGCRGPCLSLVKDTETGKIYATQNQPGRPRVEHPEMTRRIDGKVEDNRQNINYKDPDSPQAKGGMVPMKGYPGTHSEVHGVNQALNDRPPGPNGEPPSTDMSTMVIHNTRTEDGAPDGTRMTRCTNCRDVTHGAQALYDAPDS